MVSLKDGISAGWIDERMDGGLDGWMNGWMNGWIMNHMSCRR